MQNDHTSSEEIRNTLGIDKESKSYKKWWVILTIIVLLAAASAIYFLVLNKKTDNVKYITSKVEKKDLVVKVSATGNIEPTNTVDVGIEVSGTITHLYADFNDKVKKGEVLARIDTTKLESRVKNSQAALLVAKANLTERKISVKDKKNELERGQKTYRSTKGKYPSDKELDALKNDYDRALAAYKASEASVNQANAQLKSDEDDLKKAVVRSPINGIVLDKKVEVGQSVASSLQVPVLFTLAEDLSKMQVVLSVDEADIGKVHEGQGVVFSVDAYPEREFKGSVVQVRYNSIIVSGVVTYSTVVNVDNSLMLLRPGMTANADIITRVIKDTLQVPNSALRFSLKDEDKKKKKGESVWVLQEGTPKKVRVKAAQSDGISTSVSSDELKVGMQVITNTQKEK